MMLKVPLQTHIPQMCRENVPAICGQPNVGRNGLRNLHNRTMRHAHLLKSMSKWTLFSNNSQLMVLFSRDSQ